MASEIKGLKNHVSLTEFCETMQISKPLITHMRKRAVLPDDVFTKSGRQLYIHVANAKKAMKSAPITAKGRVPAWAITVGNKDALAKAKALQQRAA